MRFLGIVGVLCVSVNVSVVFGLLKGPTATNIGCQHRHRTFLSHKTSITRLPSTGFDETGAVEQLSKVFEPQFDAVPGLLLIVATTAVAAGYWWNVLIPDRRQELAISKRRGDVKEYLDDLKEAETVGDKQLERWLLTDWLRDNKSAKPAALPFLKKAKWNSGDNPVLVAVGGIMACVIAASLSERLTM
jgi:hypothetical protein